MGELFHQLIDSVMLWMTELGAWGIAIGLAIEIIPSEIVLAYGGYLVYKGVVSIPEAVLFGTIGIMIAQWLLYWIGLYGGRPFVEKYGKYLMLKPKYLDIAEGWFEKYGGGVVFTARFVPVLRQAISIPAGMARMSFFKFSFYTVLATIPWCIIFILLGKALGDNWKNIDEAAGPFMHWIIWGAVALIVVYAVYKIVQIRRKGGSKNGAKSLTGAEAAGLEGEKHTAHQLKYVGKEYRVFNRRRVRIGQHVQEFDHIVVGPNGVFHIDSKHWSGEIEFSEKGVTRSNSESKAEDPTGQMYRHEFVLKELLRHHQVKAELIGVICFTHPSCSIIGKSPAFETLKADRLLHLIKTYRVRKTLTAEEVQFIARLIETHSQPS
jgi:membrane protein DedA with SNARE-associated domain